MDTGSHEAQQPQFELPPQPTGEERKKEEAIEHQPILGSDSGGSKPASPAASMPQPVDPGQFAQPASAVGSSDDSKAKAPHKLPADDVDLIEKHWVERAKAIVEKTHNDPFMQNREMSQVKAEYIQKRYNKTIKTDNTQ